MDVRIIIPLLLNLLFAGSCFSQTLNYHEVFGEDWDKAVKYENDNRKWLEPLLNRSHVSYPVAVAIIFPELIRYSALRDKMETAMLKTLYVNLGEDYANFSIGEFQMKPSFAELIRSQFSGSYTGKNVFKKTGEFDNIKDFRRSIVKDLDDPEIQAIYLIAFIKICESKFRVSRMEESYQIRFLATAYNFGFEKARKNVDAMINRKFFSTKLIKSENYCYADISLYWYKEFTNTGH
jgi:hypothetical protein